MIKVIPNGKTFDSLDKLKRTLDPTSIDNEEGLVKKLNKGDNVYVYINPYDSELSNGEDRTLVWHDEEEKAKDAYYLSSDEI